VRRLIEQSTLTYGEIAARSGVARASICRRTRDFGWQRHVFAPRAGQKLKLRLLAERLRTLAERYARELEETPGVDLDRLVQALLRRDAHRRVHVGARGSDPRRAQGDAAAASISTARRRPRLIC
jgi:hypothetical protein